MKRILVLAVVVFVLALMVSSVSAGGGRVDAGGANNVVSLMGSSVSLDGGESSPVIFAETADSGTVTLDTIKVDPTIGK